MENQETKQWRCANCDKEIAYGQDVITVEKGVIGPRGIVPLGEVRTFCSEECVGSFFDDTPTENLPKFPPRIP